MSGLILKLRPHEAFMLNGVIVENGDRRARLRIKSEGANILRLRDAIRPEEATTPLRQAYYVAQRAVAGELGRADAARLLTDAVQMLATTSHSAAALQKASDHLQAENFYAVMRALGDLMAVEEETATRTRA